MSETQGADPGLLDVDVEDVLARVRFDGAGLVPAIVQQRGSGRVLMVAWMDEAALRETMATRRGTYFSRSRQRRWVKGESSGHVQDVRGVHLDCDGDALLLIVDQHGPACHTGHVSCFDVEGLDGAADGAVDGAADGR